MNLPQAGTDSFLVHWEGNNDLSRTVQRIKALGKRVGVAINPATSAAVLEEIMQDLDQVLVMTVNPGFGHQHFLHTTLPKIRRARQMIDRIKPECGLEVDGGVDATTAPLAVAAGADVLVAGSAIFNDSESVTAAMERLRAAIRALTEKDVMQLAMIGLGRMGANMVRRLLKGGHQCVVFDMSPKAVEDLAKEKAVGASSRR